MASRSAAKSKKKSEDKDRELSREQMVFEDESSRRDVAFQAALGDYYGRQNRARVAKGWDNFYTGEKPALDVPAMPNIQDYLTRAPGSPQPTPTAPLPGGQGAGGRMGP